MSTLADFKRALSLDESEPLGASESELADMFAELNVKPTAQFTIKRELKAEANKAGGAAEEAGTPVTVTDKIVTVEAKLSQKQDGFQNHGK